MKPNEVIKKKKDVYVYEVECKKCGYKWDYKGKLSSAVCPSCSYHNRLFSNYGKSGIEVMCLTCGHKWMYKGLSFFSSCPRCRNRVLTYPKQYKDFRDKKLKKEDIESVLRMIRDGKPEAKK